MINQVINGDCLEVMQNIEDKSINMILCDLPYGTTACSWDVIIPFDHLWKQYERIIKDNGAIVLTASQPFTSALVMSNPKLFRHEWIWDKVNITNPFSAKISPLKQHESILVFGLKTPKYFPIVKHKPFTDRRPNRTYKRDKGLRYEDGVYSNSKSGFSKDYNDTVTLPKSILTINSGNRVQKSNNTHPTQKPVELFEYLIKTYTNEGDLVLDNCAGSGTTAIACLKQNRNYILIEKEEKYFNMINKRIEDHKKQLKLL